MSGHRDSGLTLGRWFPVVLAAALIAIAMSATSVEAQLRPRSGTFVAVPEEFPEIDARVLIVRERGRDIVVLHPEEATSDALAMALHVLQEAREKDPTPRTGQMIPITGFSVTSAPRGEELRRLEVALLRLEGAPVTDVGNLGPGRWIRYH